MYRGHAGLSLILLSPFILLFKSLEVNTTYVLATCVLMVALSFLPDLDLGLRKYGIRHRGITHTFLFGAVVGVLLAVILAYGFGSSGWLMGFVAGFGGTASHLLGDAVTHSPCAGAPFKPFYPFSDKELAYGFFRASNKTANNVMLVLGIFAFIISYVP